MKFVWPDHSFGYFEMVRSVEIHREEGLVLVITQRKREPTCASS